MKCIPSSFVPNINTDNKERLSKPSALEGLPDEERQARESERGAEGETSQRLRLASRNPGHTSNLPRQKVQLNFKSGLCNFRKG